MQQFGTNIINLGLDNVVKDTLQKVNLILLLCVTECSVKLCEVMCNGVFS